MITYEQTALKIHNLPESLLKEVDNFIDFLQMRENLVEWQLWQHFKQSMELSESDMTDYLKNLEDYEEQLVLQR
jgi:hypothetical protein